MVAVRPKPSSPARSRSTSSAERNAGTMSAGRMPGPTSPSRRARSTCQKPDSTVSERSSVPSASHSHDSARYSTNGRPCSVKSTRW